MPVKRGQRYFPQLEGLQRAFNAVRNDVESAKPAEEVRTPEHVQELKNKQAAKLARRAARYKS